MSSTNSHQANAVAAAAAAAALTTNQTLSSPSHHQAANLIGFQRQQELIKLLTQHFHQQFYQQLAANNSSDLQQRQQQYAAISHGRIAAQSTADQLASQYQQHYQAAQNLSAISRATNDLSPLDHQQNQHFLVSQILRSQRLGGSASPSTITGAAGQSLPETCVDFPPPTFHNNLLAGAYPTVGDNGYNLFSALGLNLFNNQTGLRQQQTISATRDGAVAGDESTARQRQRQTIVGHKDQGARKTTSTGRNDYRQHLEDGNTEQGKEFLKFSINTILATSSSPKSSSTILDESSQPLNEDAQRDANEQRSRRSNHIDESDAPDCDSMVELDSDASSIGSSPAAHASGASSILFNGVQRNDHHHLSANTNFTSSGSINVAPKVQNQGQNQKLLTQHQSHLPPTTGGHPSLPFLTGSTTFPWTVAARGKPRRGMMRRAVFSDSQRVGLEKRFQLQKYISKPDRKKLAEKLGLRDSQVKIWFQNRRMKWRNSKERELLSAGGSREQTLPTRNNPNPDLSDVGETVKRIASSNSSSITSSNHTSTK